MEESTGLLHDFIQLKSLAPDAVKKCQRINNEEKTGQTIYLDEYNSRDFSFVLKALWTFKPPNFANTKENVNVDLLDTQLNILLENNRPIEEIHNESLAIFNSKITKN